MAEKTSKTITGLEPNVEAALCYVLGWVSGLLFLLLEKDNKKIRFHAMQSLVTFGFIHILYMVLVVVLVPVMFAIGPLAALLGIIMPLIGIGSFILWLVLIVKTYQGEEFVVPILGEFAKKQLK
ncbi:DUF4870 domain-containing protein [Candidatus Beckwithbacteria bacterium]|nr:DUF4870 domain-containing protein [Candidatus Beckwithbacteria bacterium]